MGRHASSLLLSALVTAIVAWPRPAASSTCDAPNEVLELELASVTLDGAPASRAPYEGYVFAVRGTLTCFGARDAKGDCPDRPASLVAGLEFVASQRGPLPRRGARLVRPLR